MKTFIAEGVLCDYQCGLVCISARGMRHAKEIVDKMGFSDDTKEDIKSKLKLLEAGTLVYCYGSA